MTTETHTQHTHSGDPLICPTCDPNVLKLSDSTVDGIIALRRQNDSFLAALEGLTVLDEMFDGGIIIGPQGWANAQTAIRTAREASA